MPPLFVEILSYPRASHHPGGVLGEALLLRSLTLRVGVAHATLIR